MIGRRTLPAMKSKKDNIYVCVYICLCIYMLCINIPHLYLHNVHTHSCKCQVISRGPFQYKLFYDIDTAYNRNIKDKNNPNIFLFVQKNSSTTALPSSFQATLEFNKAKHKRTPDSKNIFQLFFRSRMEGKKADNVYRQQSNLFYKGHVIRALGNWLWLLISQAKGNFAAALIPLEKPTAH